MKDQITFSILAKLYDYNIDTISAFTQCSTQSSLLYQLLNTFASVW